MRIYTLFDILPNNASHFIAIHFNHRICDMDFLKRKIRRWIRNAESTEIYAGRLEMLDIIFNSKSY